MNQAQQAYLDEIKIVMTTASQNLPKQEYIDLLEQVEDEANARQSARKFDGD